MASTSNQTLPVDTTVGGQCVIERHLRNGVMTEVYRARREGSGRERFEVRRFTLVASNDALRVVRRELDRIQRLHLAAIPSLVDVIDDPVGLLVVTTTASEGATSLRVILDAAGSLDPSECVRVVSVVAGVLDALHGASPPILHRRLSPDTITLIGPERDVRVEECGLAQALVEAGLVNARVPLQARQYLSPDELLQRPSPRGDVFALASVAFECLTGRPAFHGATEASLSAAILRGVRPSVNALRTDVPKAVDAVLTRAWAAEASKAFPTATAMADALATAMGGTARAPAPRVAPVLGSPPAGTPVLTPNELNVMKSTILGAGNSSRPPGMAPRAKAVDPERAALEATIAANPARPRMVGGRPQMPTQKVEVPRIHPPGTERVVDEAERPTFPPARLPPAAPPIKVVPSEPGARNDLFNIADIEGLDIPLAAEGAPISGRPMLRASSVPPPIPRVPSRSPTILRGSAPPPAPELPSPSTEVTFEMDAEIPASVVDDEADSWEVPAAPEGVVRPPSMPSLPRVTARPPEPSPDPEVEIEPEPEPEPEPDPEPSMPVFVIPADNPVVQPQAYVPPVFVEHVPVFAPVSPEPVLDPVSIPPPIAPSFAPADHARFTGALPPDPPPFVAPQAPPVPANLATVKILGASIVLAAVVVTAGQIYLARTNRVPAPPRQVSVVLVPTPVPPAPVAVGTIDASTVPSRDAGPLAVDVASTDAVAAAVDAAVVASDAPVAARLNVTVDASTASPAAPWNVEVFGAANDPPRSHPRRRDIMRLEEVLEPSVRQCVGPGAGRHVRMTVAYAGPTGRPSEVRISGVYAQPPAGQCLENLMRANPIPPFTDESYESNFVFNTRDEDEE